MLGVGLLVIGLLVSATASWYLWGTGWLTARSQTQLEQEFQERLLGIEDVDSVPLGVEARIAAADVAAPREWDDPTIAVAPPADPEISLDDLTDLVLEAAPAVGAPLGRITIERIDLDWIVVEGVDLADLAKGPGHMPWTALPGQPGNAVISGHRTTNGAPFYSLDVLEPGDRIVVETVTGTHTYQVVESRIVAPSDIWVTTQWEGGWLTLTTCHPLFSAQQRLIVFAQLVDGPNAAVIHGRWGLPATIPEA